ncbi:glycosyltransferase family 2 protein [Nocardioides sp.]|uniref:glycosyltransferase family 2 protein n=1 Tax=Nocardioides sp. TaxID=35761 RepID=UPI002D16670A|nr:glycosyltransferase family 2 protein [Nocardioides sp.]HXH77211.1 glycosyltransferase family 2 protein [Nocardioides sp.]
MVVPHYGDPAPTTALVERLRAQRGVTLQIIVADDHSVDPFPRLPGIEVVRREANGGFGSNVNSGVAAAAHDLLLVLNSDVEIDDTFVADLVKAARPWLPAVVSPRVVSRQGNNEWIGRHFPKVRHQVVESLHPLVRLRPRLHDAVGHDTAARGQTNVVDWVVGAAMLIPTATFRSVGGFDQRFFMNSEEVDLQRRLRETGVPSVVVSEPTLVHEGGGSSPSLSRRRWLVQSRLAYARKWSGVSGERRLRTALVLATCANFLWNAARALAGRDSRPVSSLREELAAIRPGARGSGSRAG